jgi:hypothetical protein
MDPAKGFLAKPGREQVAEFCGRCHSNAEFMRRYNPSIRVDQVAEYASSVHGRRLTGLGDPKTATCVSCHPAHSIRPPTDPLSSVNPLNVPATCARCHADSRTALPPTSSSDTSGVSTGRRCRKEVTCRPPPAMTVTGTTVPHPPGSPGSATCAGNATV